MGQTPGAGFIKIPPADTQKTNPLAADPTRPMLEFPDGSSVINTHTEASPTTGGNSPRTPTKWKSPVMPGTGINLDPDASQAVIGHRKPYPYINVPQDSCVAPPNVHVSGDGAVNITGNVTTTNKGTTCR